MTALREKFNFRLVVLGSNKTGKTAILNRFLFKRYDPKYKATVEDLFSKEFDLGSIEISVDFLDTSGDMQFPAMRRLSISTANAFLLVYAVDDQNSYEVLKMCVSEIRDIRADFQEIPIVFAGNKCDCSKEERKVLKETVSNYVYYELPRMRTKLVECSSKEDINIEAVFRAYLPMAKVSLSKGEPSSRQSAESNINRSNPTLEKRDTNKGLNKQLAGVESDQVGSATAARKGCHSSSMKLARKGQLLLEDVIQTNDHQTSCNNNDNTDELNLETAMRLKLQVDSHSSKPRSRSLIWRPSRKGSRNNNNNNSEPNCYPS